MKSIIVALVAAFAVSAAPAQASPKADSCHTKSCMLRVEMKRYKQHPLPWCTWGPESPGFPEWSSRRYRVWNKGSTSLERASGKFQIIGSTWRNYGGSAYAKYAAYADPVYQERVARKVARNSLTNWVNC